MAKLDEDVSNVSNSATKNLYVLRLPWLSQQNFTHANPTLRSSDLHYGQHKRLHDLVQKRAEIEQQIVKHCRVLDKAYRSANRELQAAARGRLEVLEPNQEDKELQGHAGGVDERQVPGREAVKNAEEMARKGKRV